MSAFILASNVNSMSTNAKSIVEKNIKKDPTRETNAPIMLGSENQQFYGMFMRDVVDLPCPDSAASLCSWSTNGQCDL
jgi:hypothetical protein